MASASHEQLFELFVELLEPLGNVVDVVLETSHSRERNGHIDLYREHMDMPVLLSTLTNRPELDLPHPICRYVVPAGEAFPSALVEPWTRGRRQVINTYGPTEASTDTSRQSLRPGEAVTIGSPLANVRYVILEPGGLQPLPHGQAGELCIGGVHVARGYRNLPQQTAAKFIDHPTFGRLYRTGDISRIEIHTQRVHFLGRIDAQLKVRGHRVEVQAVEDILQNQFGEIEAAVLDYQNQELVAFIAAPSLLQQEVSVAMPAPQEWSTRVRDALARQLPEPSVPARLFLVEKFELKPTSGKIDREHLPRLAELELHGEFQARSSGDPAAARNNAVEETPGDDPGRDGSLEPGAEQVLGICRAVLETDLGWDDVFADSGGHSIAIAQLTQRLQDAGWPVTVRALLSDCNTPRKVALYHPQTEPGTEAEKSAEDDSGQPRRVRDEKEARVLNVGYFTALQALLLALLYAPPLFAFLAVVGSAEIGEFFMTGEPLEFLGIGLVMYLFALASPFGSLLWVMVIKRCLGGDLYRNNVSPGVYPRWSRMHLRTWYIWRLERSVLVPLRTMFRSAPLMSFALRTLGADVGKNLQCAHDADFSGPLDLLCVEDNVAIQTGAYLHMSQWQGQELHIGPIHLESGCKIGLRAGIAGNVSVGQGSWITPFTPILASVGAQEIWSGAPARLSGRCVELKRTARQCQYSRPFWFLETLNILMQVCLDFLLLIVPTALVAWTAVMFIPVNEAQLASEYFRVTPLPEVVWHMGLYAFVTTWFTVTLVSVLGCLFLRFTALSPGLYPSRGLRCALLMYRMVKMNQIQRQWTWTITGQYLRALAGLRFSRLGASECDVMFNLVPELASADAQVFWSNGCFTNMLDYGAEYSKLRRLDMPRNFFSGNNSVAEFGQFPSNFLLGVSTPGSDIQFRRQMQSRPGKPITVAGNPPVKFASARFEDENASHKLPSLGLFLGRVFLNDIFSIGILPIANVLVYVVVYTNLLRMDGHPVASALMALLIAEILLVMACAAIKKLLVGSNWGAAHSAPFWSWRHFSYFFAQDCFFAWCRLPLAFTAGTTMSNTILRMMGCRIGKRSILNSPLQASDWNAVSVGDDCMVGGYLQFHTFEDMTLKVRRTEIEDGSSVNFGATVMGGAVIDAGTTLQPLSMVLKAMHLPAGTYRGSPVETATDAGDSR
jgi:non-ribosomal peptide synthetase-like protein